MEASVFKVAQGIIISDVRGVSPAFEVTQDGKNGLYTVVLDAPRIKSFLLDYCPLLPEPAYFSVEIPNQQDGGYDIYYVDGCTRPVIEAIIKRYGDLLIDDGYARFGFFAHQTAEQLYVSDLDTIQIYTQNHEIIEKLLEKYGLPRRDSCKKLWDILSQENPCELVHVEVEEESVYDLPALLADAGIYLAGKREE